MAEVSRRSLRDALRLHLKDALDRHNKTLGAEYVDEARKLNWLSRQSGVEFKIIQAIAHPNNHPLNSFAKKDAKKLDDFFERFIKNYDNTFQSFFPNGEEVIPLGATRIALKQNLRSVISAQLTALMEQVARSNEGKPLTAKELAEATQIPEGRINQLLGMQHELKNFRLTDARALDAYFLQRLGKDIKKFSSLFPPFDMEQNPEDVFLPLDTEQQVDKPETNRVTTSRPGLKSRNPELWDKNSKLIEIHSQRWLSGEFRPKGTPER